MAQFILEDLVPKASTLQIRHPVSGETEFVGSDGQPATATFTVVGLNSKQFMDFAQELRKSEAMTDTDPMNLYSPNLYKILAACVIDWSADRVIDEPYSKEAALDLLSKDENLWLRLQILNHLRDLSHFFTVGSTPSSSVSGQEPASTTP
jgi:hypothetical protein